MSAASWVSSVADRGGSSSVRGNNVTGLDLNEVTRNQIQAPAPGGSVPSRTTLACGTCRFDKASMLALAFSSCRVPSTTLSRMSRPTMTPVDTWPITKLTAVTAMSMMFIGLRSWTSAIASIEGGFSAVI